MISDGLPFCLKRVTAFSGSFVTYWSNYIHFFLFWLRSSVWVFQGIISRISELSYEFHEISSLLYNGLPFCLKQVTAFSSSVVTCWSKYIHLFCSGYGIVSGYLRGLFNWYADDRRERERRRENARHAPLHNNATPVCHCCNTVTVRPCLADTSSYKRMDSLIILVHGSTDARRHWNPFKTDRTSDFLKWSTVVEKRAFKIERAQNKTPPPREKIIH